MSASKTEREKRLAEALRANLRKRKGPDAVPLASQSGDQTTRKPPR